MSLCSFDRGVGLRISFVKRAADMRTKFLCGKKGFPAQQSEKGWLIAARMKLTQSGHEETHLGVARDLAKGDIVTRSVTGESGQVVSVAKATVLVEVWAGATMRKKRWPLSEAHCI